MIAVVMIWALRLGSFLFSRIKRDGKDGRFDDIKPSFVRFFHVWTLQGLWVTFTVIAAAMTMTSVTHAPLGVWGIVGGLVWLVGFAIEVAALISPIFVTLLLTKVSGVPMLEARADEKWGGQADYEDYKKNTPVLIPNL